MGKRGKRGKTNVGGKREEAIRGQIPGKPQNKGQSGEISK